MSTYSTQNHTGLPANVDRSARFFEFVVDLGKQNLAASDVLNVWTIPADTRIAWMNWEIITDAGTTCTVDIGDGDSATGYFSSANLNQATGTKGTEWTTTKHYTAAGQLKCTMDHTNAVAKFRIFGEYLDVSPQYTMAG